MELGAKDRAENGPRVASIPRGKRDTEHDSSVELERGRVLLGEPTGATQSTGRTGLPKDTALEARPEAQWEYNG